MVKAITFDLDNTLYDYDFCHQRAMETLSLYCEEKYVLSAQEFKQKYDLAKKIVKNHLGNTGASHNRMLYMQIFLELIGMKPIVGALEMYNIYWNTMLETMKPFEQVFPLMETLRKKDIKIAVLTDLTAHIQHRKIIRLGLSEYIDVLVTSEEAGQEKPDSRMFDLLLEKLALEPYEVIMVGDSYEKDVLGAKRVGMHGILCSAGNRDKLMEKCLEMIENER